MSKATVKKILMSMPKEEIIGMVLEMYDARKEAKKQRSIWSFMQILTRMVSWESIRRLLQKNSIHQGDVRSQRRDSRSVGRQFLITRN